jgi:hypothetical protein
MGVFKLKKRNQKPPKQIAARVKKYEQRKLREQKAKSKKQ